MSIIPASIQNLINEFSKLPGIGPKSAERLTFYLLKLEKEDLAKFAKTIDELKGQLVYCEQCHHIATRNPCDICRDPERDQGKICVVEEPLDILAIEKTSEYKGLYHVLQGAISPIDGIGPENLKIGELVNRVKKSDKIKEVILATNATLEGEATAQYIVKLLKPFKIKITHLAQGLPMGCDLEYADEVTLGRALSGRREF